MATADELTVRIEAMKKARASGVLEVRSGDNKVTYRSVDDLSKAISYEEQDLAALTGVGKVTRRYNFVSRKGL